MGDKEGFSTSFLLQLIIQVSLHMWVDTQIIARTQALDGNVPEINQSLLYMTTVYAQLHAS